MMEMQQHEWVTAQISWDGINFARISIPKVFYSDFLKAWERGDVWEIVKPQPLRPSDIFDGTVQLRTGKEFVRLSDVKRVIIE